MIAPFVPSGQGRHCRPAHNNRLVFAGLLWILRSGAAWRKLPDKFGQWNAIDRRFRRWCEGGVLDYLLETLANLGIAEEWRVQMVDSPVIRGHFQAAAAKRGPRSGVGRSRGGFTSEIHLHGHGAGRPTDVLITAAQASDSRDLQLPMASAVSIRRSDVLVGDRGLDSDDNRGRLLIQGIRPIIPSMRSRKVKIPMTKPCTDGVTASN